MVIVFGQGHLPDQVQGHGYCFGHVGHVGVGVGGSGASKVRLAEPFLAYLLLIPHTAPTSHHDLTTRLLL